MQTQKSKARCLKSTNISLEEQKTWKISKFCLKKKKRSIKLLQNCDKSTNEPLRTHQTLSYNFTLNRMSSWSLALKLGLVSSLWQPPGRFWTRVSHISSSCCSCSPSALLFLLLIFSSPFPESSLVALPALMPVFWCLPGPGTDLEDSLRLLFLTRVCEHVCVLALVHMWCKVFQKSVEWIQ